MNKKARYSILAFGFVVFLILAPVIVLYVRGITYDFAAGTFVKTGILGVQTEPTDVKIFLDGKLERKSSGDIRFVLPQEHQVEIYKDGYFPWDKRLSVQAGQVTWANPGFSKIYLLLKDPVPKILSTGVVDFYSRGSTLAFLNNNSFFITDAHDPASDKPYALTKPVNKILGADADNKNFLLTNSTATSSDPTILIFNADSKQFSDISGLFEQLPKIQYNGNGDLFALTDGVFYKIDAAVKTKAVIAKNISAFYFQNNDLYFIQNQATTSALSISQAPYNDSQVLITSLPIFQNPDLLVTFEKQIFILDSGSLYLANNTMEKLADNVSQWSSWPQNSEPAVVHLGQFDYYSQAIQDMAFVTRSSETLSNPQILSSIDYGFFNSANKLEAIELDARNRQNQYTLYSGQNLQKFIVDSAGKTIWLLDNGDLKSLTIR